MLYAFLMSIDIDTCTVGDRIKRRMKQRGANQADLARACGISESAVSQWFGRNGTLKPENLVLLADYFRCEIRWLANGDGPEDRQAPMTDEEREVIANMRAVNPIDR